MTSTAFERTSSAHSHPSRNARPDYRLLAMVLLGLIFAVVARLVHLGRPFRDDAGIYIGMGKTLAEGGRLYQDFWDTKLPTTAFLTAPLWAIFGDAWWGYVVTQLVMSLIASACLGVAVYVVRGAGSAWAATAVSLVMLNLTPITTTGFQLETVQICFSAAAVLVAAVSLDGMVRRMLRPRRALVLGIGFGLLAGLAAMPKPTGAAILAAYAALLVLAPRRQGLSLRWTHVAGVAIGFLFILLANIAAVFALGLDERFMQVIAEIDRYADGTPWRQSLSLKSALVAALMVLPVLMALCIGWFDRRTPGLIPPIPRSPAGFPAWRLMTMLAGGWLCIELIGVMMQRRGYLYHYLPILTPAVLLFGLLVGRRLLISTLATMLIFMAISVPGTLQRATYLRAEDPIIWASRYVKERSEPDEAVFADPVGTAMLLSDRAPGARLSMLIHFINDNTAGDRFGDQLLDDLAARRPRFIILLEPTVLEERLRGWERQPSLALNEPRRQAFRRAWSRFIGYVEANYRPVAERDGLVVYERTDR